MPLQNSVHSEGDELLMTVNEAMLQLKKEGWAIRPPFKVRQVLEKYGDQEIFSMRSNSLTAQFTKWLEKNVKK